MIKKKGILLVLVNTRRYSPLRGPTSSFCRWLWPSAKGFFALWPKKDLDMLFWSIHAVHAGHTVLAHSNNSKNVKNGQKKKRKSKTNKKNHIIFKMSEEKKCLAKNAILLVFQYYEDAIRSELSSPARFRIQEGSPKPDGGGGGQKSSV